MLLYSGGTVYEGVHCMVIKAGVAISLQWRSSTDSQTSLLITSSVESQFGSSENNPVPRSYISEETQSPFNQIPLREFFRLGILVPARKCASSREAGPTRIGSRLVDLTQWTSCNNGLPRQTDRVKWAFIFKHRTARLDPVSTGRAEEHAGMWLVVGRHHGTILNRLGCFDLVYSFGPACPRRAYSPAPWLQNLATRHGNTAYSPPSSGLSITSTWVYWTYEEIPTYIATQMQASHPPDQKKRGSPPWIPQK